MWDIRSRSDQLLHPLVPQNREAEKAKTDEAVFPLRFLNGMKHLLLGRLFIKLQCKLIQRKSLLFKSCWAVVTYAFNASTEEAKAG